MDKMQHLSAMDSAFLHLETAEMPMHVGSLHRYQLPEGYQGTWYEDVKDHLAKRLHLAPVFTRKLALMPFDLANPVWIEDDDIDLDYHIRRTVLPKPGTQEQLEALAARLHSSLLDRSRPLWEFYVIEGLADGTMGFYTKVHHAAIDGQAGVALGNAMLDITPVPRSVKPPRARRSHRYQLGVAELLGAALSNTLQQVRMVGKLVLPLGKALLDSARKSVTERSLSLGSVRKLLKMPPPTPFNVSITNQRAFAALTLPLDEAKRLGKAHGASINDLVLWLCSTALREYLKESRELPEASLVAGVPVSLRAEGDTRMNNQVTMSLVDLATNEKDPLQRLQKIRSRHRVDEEHHGRLRRADPHRLPVAGRALAVERPGVAVRPLGAGRPHPRRQRRHLQRAGLAAAAVHGRREDARLLPGVHRRARRGAEHHRAELHGPAVLRPDRLPPRGARPARHRACRCSVPSTPSGSCRCPKPPAPVAEVKAIKALPAPAAKKPRRAAAPAKPAPKARPKLRVVAKPPARTRAARQAKVAG